MALPPFKKLDVSADELLVRVQDNVDNVFRGILPKQILDGVLLTSQLITTGSVNYIQHGLGRSVVGWFPVRRRSTGMVWDTQDTNADPTFTLALNSSATVTIDLWVF